MDRLFKFVALVAMFCFPLKIEAQYQLIELADVQLAKSLGATIEDPSGAPVPNAETGFLASSSFGQNPVTLLILRDAV